VVAAMANWRLETKKMRLDLEDSIVIFFWVQFVIGEDVLHYCLMLNISSFRKKNYYWAGSFGGLSLMGLVSL
jgi:hypothetical protein